MTSEERERLIEFGNEINIKVTPTEIKGELAVHYLDFESTDFWPVFRDLTILKARIPEKF